MTSAARTGPMVVAIGERDLEATLRSAAYLAEYLSRQVHVVSALHTSAVLGWGDGPRAIGGGMDPGRSKALAAVIGTKLDALFRKRPDWRVDVVPGDPARTIVAAARDNGASLIVMGIGRHRPLDRLLGAETTLATIRLSECPVLVLANELRTAPSIVVVGTDFSATSANAVRHALPLLSPRATLIFAHVWQPSHVGTPLECDDTYRRCLPARFCRFIAALELPSSITVRQEILDGHVAERLLELAEVVGAQLIIVGRHGRGVVERLLVGSVASRVLRGTTRSVLVAPERAPAPLSMEPGSNDDTFSTADSSEWAPLLASFTARNAGRHSMVSVHDRNEGTTSGERGYRLVNISYDPEDPVIEIEQGEPNGMRHLRRIISDVGSLTFVADGEGRDRLLRIAHRNGEALVGFVPDHSLVEATV